MNSVQKEMNDVLMHIGMPRRSGRYPWGSGENPYQRTRDLLGRIEQLKKEGWSETPENIKNEFGLTTNQYRAQKALAKDLRRMDQISRAESLKADGLNDSQIGREMGINESTVRSLLNADRKARTYQAMNTADFIREQIDKKGPIDIGGEVNRELGVSREKLNEALYILEAEGYEIRGGRVSQATNPGQKTTLKLICPPGTPKNAAYDYDNIHTLNEYVSQDGGDTFQKKFTYPTSMDPKRMMVRYAEDGGINKDGVIELRRGVEDLSLGGDHYSQVRILVGGTHYLKGMALYSDDMPDGVDVIFNTNKSKDVPALGPKNNTVLKPIKSDPDNPFGSAIKDADQGGQRWYQDVDGTMKLGLINKRAGEGDWTEWKDAVPSQFLSKQPISLAKKQLNLAITNKKEEYDAICALTNPTIKKHFLDKFADECDSAAVNLQAAALPGQKYRVIIPVNSLKDTEVYAPTYPDGSKLALVRYPHGGTFEIPILTVNNKHAEAKHILGPHIRDAVAINKNVADRLSGADFDGDTVMCIPTKTNGINIKNRTPLKGLEGFDPKISYGHDGDVKTDANGVDHYYRNGREYKIMKNTQNEMGRISNLITDMTIKGADENELAAAVRHSMVVIDAEKHKLDYKQSEQDNQIATLKKKYQSYIDEDGKQHFGGASTIISRSKGETTVDKRQGSPIVNIKGKKDYDPTKPEGALLYKTADDLEYTVAKINRRSKEEPNATIRVSAKGKRYMVMDGDDKWIPLDGKSEDVDGTRVRGALATKTRTQKSTQMAETDDARTLISDADSPMERAYADYANRMKAMANEARKESAYTKGVKVNREAKEEYKAEVDSLMDKLNTALLNAPRERRAQILANREVQAKQEANKDMSKEDIKKASQQALTKYRSAVGAVARRERSVKITDREWEAIQKGAISESNLKKILNNSDIDELRARATPRKTTTLSNAQISRISNMRNNNYTIEQIATKLGVSVSTVSEYLKGAN